MGCIEKAFAAARRRGGRIVMPEMDDARIAGAAERIRREGIAEPLDLETARPAEAYLEVMLRARPTL